jgi:hypothetical protein
VCEAILLHKLLTDLLDHEMDPMMITKEPCVKLLENPVFPDGWKHDEMKRPYIRDMMQRKIVHMQYLPTHEQDYNIFYLVKNAFLVEREY